MIARRIRRWKRNEKKDRPANNVRTSRLNVRKAGSAIIAREEKERQRKIPSVVKGIVQSARTFFKDVILFDCRCWMLLVSVLARHDTRSEENETRSGR